MDLIQSAAEEKGAATGSLHGHMKRLAQLDNVPRKEKQFRNFTANSLNLRGKQSGIVTEIWEHLCQLREKQKQEQQKQQESDDREKQRRAEEKRKQQQAEEKERDKQEKDRSKAESNGEQSTLNGVVSLKLVRRTIKRVLKKAPQHTMKAKALRVALRGELGLDKEGRRRLKEMLATQIQCKKIRVDGKRVSLI